MSDFDIGRVTAVRSIIPTSALSADLFETDTVASLDALSWLEDNDGRPIAVRIGGDPYTLTYDAQLGQAAISPAATRDYSAGTAVVPAGTSIPEFYAEVLPVGYREMDSPGTVMVRIATKDKPGIDLGTRAPGQGELITWSDNGVASDGWNQFSDTASDDSDASTEEPGDLEYEDSLKEPDISSDYISDGQDGEDPGPIDGQDPGDFGGGGDVTLIPGKVFYYYTIDDVEADLPSQAHIPEAIAGTITGFRADSRDDGGDADGAAIDLKLNGSVISSVVVGDGWDDFEEAVAAGDKIKPVVDDPNGGTGLVTCMIRIEPAVV